MTGLVTITTKLAESFDMGGNGEELVKTLKATAFQGQVSDAQMMALMVVANQYRLNPFTKEIYAFPDKQNGIVPVVGVDGWSRIINSHPQFDGMDFEQDDESCTCIIYRKDRNHPVRVTEYMDECYRPAFKNKNGYEIKGPWQSHPKRMLRHKAMIQAARLAFGYVGIYDQDEAERIAEVDMGPAQVVRKTPAETAQAAQPTAQRTEEHENIILDLEAIAKSGGSPDERMSALNDAWQGLTREDRVAIGADELKRLKAIASAEDMELANE